MVEGVGVRLNRPDLPVGGLEISNQAHRLQMVILQKLCSSHTILPRKIEDRGSKIASSHGVETQMSRLYPILNTRSSIYILLTYRSATTMPDGARGRSSRGSHCMECNLIALKQCMTYV